MRISDYLDSAAAQQPDAEALVCGSVRLTYADCARWVHSIATAFSHDARTQGRVHLAIYSGNDYRVPLLQLGANRADMVWLGVHVRNSIDTNIEVLTYMDCNVVAFGPEFESEIPRLKAAMPQVTLWLALDAASEHGTPLATWLEGQDGEYAYAPAEMSQIACILPTGGTTGPAKGAVHSHRSIEMELINLRLGFDIHEKARLLTVAPLSHAAGQFALGFIPVCGCNVILKEFDPGVMLETIENERITHLFVPPTLLYSLLIHPKVRDVNLSSITCLIVGAAPVSPEKFREAIDIFGPVLYEAYAQTETLIPILAKRPADYVDSDGQVRAEVLRTSGKPPAFVRVGVMGDDGTLLARGTPGEIVVRSSMGMSHYYKQTEATQEASAHGWHHTGDIGLMDEEGYVTLIDRKKDMIVTGAFNVYPAEVEKVINQHACVLECIVIGIPDEKWGEAVKALVRLKPGAETSSDDIIALCKRHLGSVKAPKSVEFWPDLPRSPVGKLLRREARKQFWKGHWRSI
ncbi:MAG: AMP-binding protein [Burkholderiaceae bacterium]|jgi:acyl-CoA synthetase (AMP-forming)/AMP-acid ligase II